MSFRERAMMCLAAGALARSIRGCNARRVPGQIEEALKLALTAREAPLVHETCSKINLRHLLQTEPAAVSQMILISLLQQLAMDVMTDPVSKLEWLESVALAVVPSAADIAPHLPGIARQAREALMANSHALSSLPAQHATRFRALTYILVSLEGEAR
jgi:enhancer of mRNA-decapping protein 4